MIMIDAPLVLALDTSTVVNVGLARGDRVLATASVADRMAHVEELMPLVSECVDTAAVRVADLGQLVVGVGPGPFTGLRVGVVTARILSYVRRIGLRGVCSLDVLAAQFAPESPGEFVVATDARRREVYWARYSPFGVRLEEPRRSRATDPPRLAVTGRRLPPPRPAAPAPPPHPRRPAARRGPGAALSTTSRCHRVDPSQVSAALPGR